MRLHDPFGLKSDPERAFIDDARCADVDPEIFFPNPRDVETQDLAIAICLGCNVIGECLQYAMNHPDEQGIWGGTTDNDRREMRRTNAS